MGGRSQKGGERQQVGPPPHAFVMWRKPWQAPFGAGAQGNFSVWVKVMTSTLHGPAEGSTLSRHISTLPRPAGGTGSWSRSSPACDQMLGLPADSSSSRYPAGELCPGTAASSGDPCLPVLSRLRSHPKLPTASTAGASAVPNVGLSPWIQPGDPHTHLPQQQDWEQKAQKQGRPSFKK